MKHYIAVIPYESEGHDRVMVLVTETRVNRSGKEYTRRIAIHLTVSEAQKLNLQPRGEMREVRK